MNEHRTHVKWKDLADELMGQDSRLLGQGIVLYNSWNWCAI